MIYPVLTYSRNLGDFSHDLSALYEYGLKAIRLIYKGKSEEEFNLRIREIQEEINTLKLDIDILIDLPGNKPTVGNLQKGVDVQSGFEYQLVNQDTELYLAVIPTLNFFTHDSFPTLEVGDVISIADDELNLQVMDVKDAVVSCKALNSFHLTSSRSISVKNKPFAFFANSDKDMLFVQNLQNLPQNIKLLVSFTKKAADIQKLKSIQPEIEIIPKIETILDEATLLEIMACCQTILLGRGDLSTSSKPNEIFAFEKLLIDLCKIHGKKLIIGTGLLAGIGDKQTPSISDVMDYSYLRHMGIEAFLISGNNAHNEPLKTLKFLKDFEL